MAESTLPLACPACKTRLVPGAGGGLCCPADGRVYACEAGIWRCLRPERAAYYAQFIAEYNTVRGAEGRGSLDPAYYRALPFADLSGRYAADWRVRACSFKTFLERVVAPLEDRIPGRLKILDLGAGCGWLSYRLAEHGHSPAALDLRIGELDGLGALRHYPAPLMGVQAEFNGLPFEAGLFELVVFNASLHYAADYAVTLREARRVLAPGGVLAILDTPLYRESAGGRLMVQEREALFQALYGFPSRAVPMQNYLTSGQLACLGSDLGVVWHLHRPAFGLRWRLRPWLQRLRGRREPADFPVIEGHRQVGAG